MVSVAHPSDLRMPSGVHQILACRFSPEVLDAAHSSPVACVGYSTGVVNRPDLEKRVPSSRTAIVLSMRADLGREKPGTCGQTVDIPLESA